MTKISKYDLLRESPNLVLEEEKDFFDTYFEDYYILNEEGRAKILGFEPEECKSFLNSMPKEEFEIFHAEKMKIMIHSETYGKCVLTALFRQKKEIRK